MSRPTPAAGRRALALAATLLTAALPVSGQELRTAQPENPRNPAGREQTRWSFDLGAEESYESNVPYTAFLGQDDFVSRATGRLGVIFPITRGNVELAAEGGANVYRTVKGLNRFTWGGAARLEHRFTRRSRIEAEGRVSENYARNDPRLLINGSLPPLTQTRSNSADVLWRQGLGGALEARFRGRAEQFRFDAPGLQNGWTAEAHAGMEYSFNHRVGVGFDGEYARTATSPSTVPSIGAPVIDTLSRTYEIEQLVGTLRLELGRHLTLGLEGGAARFQSVITDTTTATDLGTLAPPPANGPVTGPIPVYAPTTTPTMAATLTGTTGPHTISAIASRRVEQTYGVGSVGINSTIGLVYRLALARWVALTVSGANNHNAAADGSVLSSGRVVTAGFDCTLPAQVTVRLNYSYWDRVDPYRDWQDHTVAVGLSKRFGWR